MQRCWDLLGAVVGPAANIPGSRTADKVAAMVEGACRYLEQGHVQHVQGVIQASRIQVTPHGSRQDSVVVQHALC